MKRPANGAARPAPVEAAQDIRFSQPTLGEAELVNVRECIASGILAGNGPYTRSCHAYFEQTFGVARALLTQSCTAALEMATLLAGVRPGDEVIMPSFTFVSTANAVVLRGAVPVFVDIRPDTLNLDENLLGHALTKRTKAVIPVHYAGVGCEMDAIVRFAKRHRLFVIEDAAQGMLASYRGRQLGTIGHLGALSFHETKNVVAGEGGALFVNRKGLVDRAEIVWEKGTNRTKFFRGEVDKYTWIDVGSSFLPSELTAALLAAQLGAASALTERRQRLWARYHAAFSDAEAAGLVRRPVVPGHCQHNGHLYYLLFPSEQLRNEALRMLRNQGIHAVFHYVPLHTSPAGRRFGRAVGRLRITDDCARRLLRLPLYAHMADEAQNRVIGMLQEVMQGTASRRKASARAR